MTTHTAREIRDFLREKGIPAPVTPPGRAVNIARTLNWLLVDLVAKGMSLAEAEQVLTEALAAQAADLRRAGLM